MNDDASDSIGTHAQPTAVTPVLTATDCRQELPAWGITREFRFGQYIRLFDERKDKSGKSVVTALVLNQNGDVVDPEPPRANATPQITDGSRCDDARHATAGQSRSACGRRRISSGRWPATSPRCG